MSIEHKYIYNGALLTRQELHSAGVLLGNAQPEEATVYSDDAGALGTRYTSESDGIIVKSEGDIYYYATQAECDAEWTTYEPAQEFIVYTNQNATLSPVVVGYSSSNWRQLFDASGNPWSSPWGALEKLSESEHYIQHYSGSGNWTRASSAYLAITSDGVIKYTSSTGNTRVAAIKFTT